MDGLLNRIINKLLIEIIVQSLELNDESNCE